MVATEPHMAGSPYWSFVQDAAERCPTRTALRIVATDGREGEAVTFAEMRDQGLLAASYLHFIGVGEGSIVATALPNTEVSVAISIGTARLGAVWAPADQDLSLEQTVRLLCVYGPVVAFLTSSRVAAAAELAQRMSLPAMKIMAPPSLEDLRSVEVPVVPTEQPVADESPALMVLTSGTTGLPKSVVTTSLQLRNIPKFDALQSLADAREECIVYFGSPAWVSYSLLFLTGACRGHTLVLGQGYTKDLYFSTVLRHKPSFLFFWPEVVVEFLTLPQEQQAQIASFAKALAYAGARTPQSALLKMIHALPKTSISQGYASSETFKVSLLSSEDHAAALHTPDSAVVLRRLRSAGRCVGSVRIADDKGKLLPAGVTGQIQVLPDPRFTFTEYYKNPHATAAKFTSDGWLIMGDLGQMDEDGYLYVEGRDSETIVLLSGDNVYPNEVESVIAELQDVVEVAVVKVVVGDDAISEVGAFVRVQQGSKVTTQDVREQCQKRLGQAWSHPSHIFIQTEKLPRNKNGKCLASVLTSRASELLKARQGGA